ncbi:Clp protease N-terminal domain-containing protein [Cellulophaga omnivescoria]|uniref:Clp protease N-terminal domain-containing protein n=1 Tax=Cellulophaga omnivescoria TaxID=1888890 RepID=UPI00098528A8|nr:Clp protease N-terminal domain-containing protein [Cellulophaga omnivescoria]
MELGSELEKIIANSRLVAIDLNSEYISSFHFLIATLQSDNIAQKIFKSYDWKFQNLIELLKSDDKKIVAKYYLTKEFDAILRNGSFYARIYSDIKVNPEHIVLAMLANKNSYAGNYLNEIEMDYFKFKKECEKIRSIKSNKFLEFFGSSKRLVSLGLLSII